VIGVDDAHLLDDASAALVHQVAITRAGFVIVTVRSDLQAPDFAISLWKDGLAERLELQALSRSEVEELVARVLGGQVDGRTMQRLWELTQGNPLFVHELVLDGLEVGALDQSRGVWRWSASGSPAIRLSELLDARLGRLEPPERSVLEMLAIGEPLGLSTITALSSWSVLESLESRNLISVHQEGRRFQVLLAHPMYAEVVRASTPPLRARRIRAGLAEALGSTHTRRRSDVIRVATWHVDAGKRAAPSMLVSAAFQAVAASDFSLGERLARAAVSAGGGFWAAILLSYCLQMLGRSDEGGALVSEWELKTATDRERVQVTIARVDQLANLVCRPADAVRVIERAEQGLRDSAYRDHLAVLRGHAQLYAGLPAVALEAIEPVVNRRGVERLVLVSALLVAVPAWAIRGRSEKAASAALEWSDAAVAYGREAHELVPITAPGRLPAMHALALRLGGRLAEAEAVGEGAYRTAVQQGAHDDISFAALVLGQVALSRGRGLTATRWLREAAELLRTFDHYGVLAWCLGDLARARCLAGALTEAEALLMEAEATRPRMAAITEAEIGLAHAWVMASRGEVSAARARLREVAVDADTRGQLAFSAAALHDLVRFGGNSDVIVRLDALAAEVEGDLVSAYAAHAHALAGRDGDALDKVSSSLASSGAVLLAAEAAIEAAVAHRDAGRDTAAKAAIATARSLAHACEDAQTPSLLRVSHGPDLTAREREVAQLAMQGSSSRDIARRLAVSVRTVDNHLNQVYGKLGISGRDRLRSVLDPLAEES
jgi:DNA-binding CsgD family transcriptional regulator